MFNFDEFRVKDLDELVPLVKSENEGFDAKRLGYSYFKLGKDCCVSVNYDKKTDETEVSLTNKQIKESRVFGGKNPVAFESVDLGAIIENFIVFNGLVNPKSIFRKKAPDAVKTHMILTNIDKALEGQPVPADVKTIVSAEEYEAAMQFAKKAFNKEQEETIDSQTPVYDV